MLGVELAVLPAGLQAGRRGTVPPHYRSAVALREFVAPGRVAGLPQPRPRLPEAAGAVGGGYAGKGIGELIDPTTEDNWLRDNFPSRPYVEEGDTFEDFSPAFRYGALAEAKYGDAGIDLMDEQLQRDWEASKDSRMPWTKAKEAVKDAYERTVQLRKERAHSGPGEPVLED